MLSTHNMGGVSIQPDELRAMQANDYILHARGEKLEKVSVEKIRLPRDPEGHTQRLCLAQAPNGTIYAVAQLPTGRLLAGRIQQRGCHASNPRSTARAGRVGVSRRRQDMAQIGQIDPGTPEVLSLGFSMTRLDDGTLLVPVLVGADRIGVKRAHVASTVHIHGIFCPW